jgi:hypothetical protein
MTGVEDARARIKADRPVCGKCGKTVSHPSHRGLTRTHDFRRGVTEEEKRRILTPEAGK